MATLLHLDSSLNGDNSTSRTLTRVFRDAWLKEHPEGTVIHRDLAADPLPHLEAPAYYAGFTAPAERTPEQKAAFALREQLISEAESADAVVIGAPMYNYSVASGLKSWIDHVFAVGRTAMTEAPSLAGKPVVVVTSRGGAYGPGTPQEGHDHVQTYLTTAFGALGMQPRFIVPELTMAPMQPSMAQLVPLFEASRDRAHIEAEASAREIATLLAA